MTLETGRILSWDGMDQLKKLPKDLLTCAVRGYQIFMSPVLPQTCRFYPSCSCYALEAIREHGAWRGGWLAMKRIGRCHPWARGGFDPVPERDER